MGLADKADEYRLVADLRAIVGKTGHPAHMNEQSVIKARAMMDRVATDKLLRKFHIPLNHRNLLWSE